MNNTIATRSTAKVTRTTEYLGRSYVWALYDMLPSCGLFAIEFIEYIDEEDVIVDSLTFSRNTEDEAGRKALFELLGKYPGSFCKVDAEFVYGFGFDLKVRVRL
ncbi:MAG: hypothetical protein K6F54_13425 [Lachnospiraceae bacterium]|nr:hypothetical protein [Lachnospiraceae bacterium]